MPKGEGIEKFYIIKKGKGLCAFSSFFVSIKSEHCRTRTRKQGYYDFINAENEEAFDAYIGKCKELALYDTGVSAKYGDRLITLSTCEYSAQNGRLVVVAKKVS